jgi:hypothetical protein
VDGFVLVTGDDDFAAVAQDLKRRGTSVYALVPINGSAVPRRLAAVADLTVLLPPPPTMGMPAPSSNKAGAVPELEGSWVGEVLAALAQCSAHEDGWTTLSWLGQAVKHAELKKPKGKLEDLVRRIEGLEVQGTKANTRVRLRPCLAPAGSSAEPFVPGEKKLVDGREIPF